MAALGFQKGLEMMMQAVLRQPGKPTVLKSVQGLWGPAPAPAPWWQPQQEQIRQSAVQE